MCAMVRDVQRSKMDRAVTKLVAWQRAPVVGGLCRAVLYALGVEIPAGVTIGQRLTLVHPTSGVVIHPETVIGDDVLIFHNVTIGRANPWEPVPAGTNNRVIIGDGAILCAGATLLFTPGQDLVIGAGAVIGAMTVTTRDVPAGRTWAGSPPRLTEAD